MKDVLPRVII